MRGWIPARAAVAAALLLLAACPSSENDDCAEFNPPPKTDGLGDSCSVFHYGTCPTAFGTCGVGECRQTTNGPFCVVPCGSGCASGTFCKNGYCEPHAVCTTYCDGVTCCNYSNDPADPTTCLRGSCY
jgi:hypothetical protein